MNSISDILNYHSYCSFCVKTNNKTTTSSEDPYALHHLLAAGTLVVNLEAEPQSRDICNYTDAEDLWHSFEYKTFTGCLTTSDEILCQGIDFLIKHHFVSVLVFNVATKLYLRVYLIPHDLSGVQGRLRMRKEAILGPARRYLRILFPKIMQDPDSWQGKGSFTGMLSLAPVMRDLRTLAEIYSELKSPQARITQATEPISSRLLNPEDSLGGLGLRSRLYKYQRVSVAAMVNRELDLSDIPDPLFITLRTMTQEVFYLQPGTMEILQECPMVTPSCGGVLCEELGTGKTIMVLALILITIDQISSPEESIIDDQPVMTPLSFRHFPSSECIAARKRSFYVQGDNLPSYPSRIPSLVELLMHYRQTIPDTRLRNTTSPQATQRTKRRYELELQVEKINPGQLLAANVPFYFHYQDNPANNQRFQRTNNNIGPKIMYLTSATLIIVPPNLISQWDREIQKHCSYPLQVLILRTGTPMPPAVSLASNYDIILMTYKRFTAENNFNDKAKLHSWGVCHCPEFSGSRVPNCHCKPLGISPLLQIRWKRLVIDEGHVSASLSSILTPFTKLLSVERRWIVTGTPTTNLLGLGFGKRTNEEVAQNQNDVMSKSPFEVDGLYQDQYTPSRSHSPLSESLNDPQLEVVRVWNKYDREDLNKLGKMITHFVAVPQFAAQPKIMQTHITEPLLDSQGPRSGAIQVLNQVMEMIMIRHRIEDVEQDVVLPPVKQEAVLLDLDPYAVKSYNALQATIAINAIDSQRTDQDYMFHPRNTNALQLTLKNMSQLMFWSTDETLYYVDELCGTAESQVNRAMERKVSRQDMSLLEEALKHIKAAAEDPLWRAIQEHEDVPYRISGMDQAIFETWTRTPQHEPHPNPLNVGFLHTDRILKIRATVIQRPRITKESIIELGNSIAEKDQLQRRIYKEALKDKLRKTGSKLVQTTDNSTGNTNSKAENKAKKAKDKSMLQEMQKELDAVMARMDREDTDSGMQIESSHDHEASGRKLLSTSLLGKTRLGSSASSKLNYIINEVIQYAPTEKFLIFSDSELSLAHLSEALDIIQIKFLRFTTMIEPKQREQMVVTFETSEKYRVFLMELKHGARGLNLISASRVIFCEPVWQADVESQAIKRAHRIGQTRPITVKTLAIRGTAEENMVARRNILKDRQEKLPRLIEEAGMRHYIANPKFIDYESERCPTVDVPLINTPAGDGTESATMYPRQTYIRVESPVDVTPSPSSAESPKKKRKGVRFE